MKRPRDNSSSGIRSVGRLAPVVLASVFMGISVIGLWNLTPCIYLYCARTLLIPFLYLFCALAFRRCGAVVRGGVFLLMVFGAVLLVVIALSVGRDVESTCPSSHTWIWVERQ